MGITYINTDGTQFVADEVGKSDRLTRMMTSAGSIGSDKIMFGEVPNGARAAEALRRAVDSVTQQVIAAGREAGSIQTSALTATRIGEQTDQETARVQREALAQFDGVLSSKEQARARLDRAEAMS